MNRTEVQPLERLIGVLDEFPPAAWARAVATLQYHVGCELRSRGIAPPPNPRDGIACGVGADAGARRKN